PRQNLLVGIGRLLLLPRRHDPRPDVLEHLEPNLRPPQQRLLPLHLIQRQPALVHAVPVTLETILLKQRPNLFLEPPHGLSRRSRQRGLRSKPNQHENSNSDASP